MYLEFNFSHVNLFWYREITELNKSNAAQDSKAQETALSVEMHVREELKMTLEREQHSYKQEREALIMQVMYNYSEVNISIKSQWIIIN